MFAGLHVTASAPDRSVTARISHRAGFGVEFDHKRIDGHTDESLAAAVTTAITATLAGYRQALDRLAQATGSLLDRSPQAVAAERERLRRVGSVACRDVTTTALSAGRRARIRLRGIDRAECRIRPGTLADPEVTLARLALEITSAYNQAKFQHRQSIREVSGRNLASYV